MRKDPICPFVILLDQQQKYYMYIHCPYYVPHNSLQDSLIQIRLQPSLAHMEINTIIQLIFLIQQYSTVSPTTSNLDLYHQHLKKKRKGISSFKRSHRRFVRQLHLLFVSLIKCVESNLFIFKPSTTSLKVKEKNGDVIDICITQYNICMHIFRK